VDQGGAGLAHRKERAPERVVRFQEPPGVTAALGEREQALAHLARRLVAAARVGDVPQPPERLVESRRVTEILGQLVRAAVRGFDLRRAGARQRDEGRPQRGLERELERRALSLVGHRVQEIAAAADVRDGFPVGATLERVLGGLVMIPGGAGAFAAALEVQRQGGGALAWPLAERRFVPLADAAMEAGALGGRQALVEHVLVEDVEESVARGDRPVRPRVHAGGPYELLATSERRAAFFDGFDLVVQRGGQRRRRERHPRHAGRRQQPLVGGAEPLELLLDHLAKVLGYRDSL
jgi:hypothetical protein